MPRAMRWYITRSQNLAPSVCSTQIPEDFLLAVSADADGQVGGVVLHRAGVAALAHDGGEEDHGPYRVQGPRLPFPDLVEDGVGDLGDQVRRDLDS